MEYTVRFLLLLMLSFLIVCQVFGQGNSTGNWFIYFGNQDLGKKFNWHNEIQYRNYNFIGDLQQLLLRTGIGYNLSDNNHNIHLGYAFIRNNPYVKGTNDKFFLNEHRIYQQFILRDRIGRFFFQHRYRIEERFFPDDFSMRLRYFLGINVPLNHVEMRQKSFYLSIYNEIFVNTKPSFFDRNRFYMGLGYAIKRDLRFELAYMIQRFEDSQFFQTYNRPQFQVVLFNNLPFTKNN